MSHSNLAGFVQSWTHPCGIPDLGYLSHLGSKALKTPIHRGVGYFLLGNKLPQVHLPKVTRVYCFSLFGPGIQACLSRLLCSGAHRAAARCWLDCIPFWSSASSSKVTPKSRGGGQNSVPRGQDPCVLPSSQLVPLLNPEGRSQCLSSQALSQRGT